MNELLNTRSLSVAETLEQARLALKTHRTWMKTRSAVAPGQAQGKGSVTQQLPPFDVFTSKERESSTLESEDLSKEDEGVKTGPLTSAPPPLVAKKWDSKVAPAADQSFLPQQGTLSTPVPPQFYSTRNVEQIFVIPEDSKKLTTQKSSEGDNKDFSLSVQKRRGISKSRIVPLSKAEDDKPIAPTSPAGVFYGNLPGKTPPAHNGWTDEPPEQSLFTGDKSGNQKKY